MKSFLTTLMILVVLACLLWPAHAIAAPDNGNGQLAAVDPELGLFFEQEDLIVTATKQPQTLKKAPAVATVFTARDIRLMGARDIMDVLKRVPGIGVSKSFYGPDNIEVRGLLGFRSEQVKFLIDGVSVNNLSGGAAWNYDSLSVDNVKRIEVIRGPSSALYGTDAMSAIINIITKKGEDIDGAAVSAGGGSFNTQKYYFEAGKKYGNDLDVAFTIDYITTDGDKLNVGADSIGNSGDTEDFLKKLDTQLRLSYKDLALNFKHIMQKKGGFLGAGKAVNNESEQDLENYLAELSYRRSFLDEKLALTVKAYYRHHEYDIYWEIFPEGFPGYPDGMIGNPLGKEKDFGVETQTDWRLGKKNLLTIGASFEKQEQYDIRSITNFHPITFAPLGSIMDITSWGAHARNETRYIKAVYLQDIWDISDDLSLTLGVRHDNYSDFGGTTNPRAALVWEFKERWDLKLMYATAFRAPHFQELYIINNPSILGNPDLKPEEMETFEVSLGHTDRAGTSARVSWFHNTFTERIEGVLSPGPSFLVYANTGGARVWGIEGELEKAVLKNGSKIYANYTYQDTEDRDTHRVLANVAKHKGNVGADIAITENFNANLNVFWSGERPRAMGDPRDALASYTLVDATLIATGFYKDLELRLSGHNIFDEKYEDPEDITVPGDLPRDGVSVMADVTYRF